MTGIETDGESGIGRPIDQRVECDVHPFEPTASPILVLEAERPLAFVASFSDLPSAIRHVLGILIISGIDRVRDETTARLEERFQMFEKSLEAIEVLDDSDVVQQEHGIHASWNRIKDAATNDVTDAASLHHLDR